MRNQYVVGLMSLVMFTACGKSTHLVALPDKSLVSLADASKGQLTPLSKFDRNQEAKTGLPFLNAGVDQERAIGTPAFYTDSDTANGKDGYVKASNLTFRGITQVPPIAKAMKSIRDFSITLNNVRIYADGGLNAEDVVASQILCILDTKICIGGKQDTTEKTHNPAFWGTAQMAKEMALVSFGDLKSIFTTPDTAKGVVFAYSPGAVAPAVVGKPSAQSDSLDPSAPIPPAVNAPAGSVVISALKIDLKAALGLSDSDLADWILKNSTPADETKNYRKFQFVLGDNIYASAGNLNLQYDLDASVQLPANWNTPPGKPLNKKDDLNTKAEVAGGGHGPVVKLNKAGNAEIDSFVDEFSIVFNPGTAVLADGNGALDDLCDVFNKYPGQISLISIFDQMDIGDGSKAYSDIALARAKAVQSFIADRNVQAKVTARGRVPKKSACSVPKDCSDDRYVHMRVVTTATDLNAPVIADLKAQFGPQGLDVIIQTSDTENQTSGFPGSPASATTPPLKPATAAPATSTAPSTSTAPATSVAPAAASATAPANPSSPPATDIDPLSED